MKSFVRQKRVEFEQTHTVSHTEKRGKLCKKPARDFSKVTVDSDDMGGEVFSVRRVSDYLSSHIDLDDRIHTDMGCTQRDDGPNEVRNHHAALTPRSTQSTDLFERRTVYSRKFKTLRL